ncbi:MAG TPA: bifunctional phosphopantothenoylcysteine decarboxylase/phosphopantothenate--cysteine ligase CoaBC [Thermoplasmata archaeon]|nr:bifunctional phosphopantothenoylcysteine decarboxylase/phosphopantothenate--cysteine ligase CoaBC [Thermoplasmata archaeon]
MHPSRVIRGRTSRLLEGRRILIGISGSIAAVEVPKVVRELLRHGADVRAVMSPEATRLLTPEAVEFATGHPPVLRLTGNVEHVTLLGPGEGQADLYVIAPATANTIAKIAHGIDDTPVTSCASVALGGRVPILLVPAMHAFLGENPAVRESLDKLRGWGVEVLLGPAAEGEAKIASPEEIAAAVLHRLGRGPWVGRSVVVIGGSSREPIDAVRSVTNESSGGTALALANQAHYRGADVALWLGGVSGPVPSWLRVTRWRSVGDLLALARDRAAELGGAAAVLVPAALSDYTLSAASGKIRSRDRPELRLRLRPAPKLLPELRRLAPPPGRLVAFKLLAGEGAPGLEREARALARETGADWVVANDVRVVGAETTSLRIVRGRGRTLALEGPKPEVAGRLLDELGRELERATGPTTPRSRGTRPGSRGRDRRTAGADGGTSSRAGPPGASRP